MITKDQINYLHELADAEREAWRSAMRDFGDFYIVYPERRYISAARIHAWYKDAVANGEIAEEHCNAKTHQEMADALSDAGIITLGKAP
jgi:hypothetical protein